MNEQVTKPAGANEELLMSEQQPSICPKCKGQKIVSIPPCDGCDGHDACRDFGCAFKLGLGNMVKDSL